MYVKIKTSPVELQNFTHLHKNNHNLSLTCSRCSGPPQLDADVPGAAGTCAIAGWNKSWTLHRAQCSGERIKSQAFSLVAFQVIFHAFSEIYLLHNFFTNKDERLF